MQDDGKRSICARVAYDGSDFFGFQYQAQGPTIQRSLEESLSRCTGDPQRIVGAGRTDSGVHAVGQVIQADVAWRHSLTDLLRAWNHYLPSSILIREIADAPAGFHPRFSATSRQYRYHVVHPLGTEDVPSRFPLLAHDTLLVKERLDLERMNRAAQGLIGEHDFATFGQPPQGEVTIRLVQSMQWVALPPLALDEPGFPFQRLVFRVEANAFLRRMVRNLVGSLLAVGWGEWSEEDLHRALLACDRSRSAPPAPPHGLVLEKVFYQEYPDLFQNSDVWTEPGSNGPVK